MTIIILIIEILIIVAAVNYIQSLYVNKTKRKYENWNYQTYQSKPIMTNCEYNFYRMMQELENEYIIVPQLNLASVIKKTNNTRYYNDLFKNIDFAIFTKDYRKLLLLIEINDSTHNRPDRQKRDINVKRICNEADIPLMTFYTNKPNEPHYVINRIKNAIYYYNNTSN